MKAYTVFRLNLKRTRSLINRYDKLIQEGKSHEAVDDLLRSSLIMIMGSLDAYIHQLIVDNLVAFVKRKLKDKDRTRLGNIERFLNKELMISPLDYLEMLTLDRPFVRFRTMAEIELLKRTYQSPEKIDEAFKLFGVNYFWRDLEQSGKKFASKAAAELASFYKRRNMIVHELDRERSRKRKHKKRTIHKQTCLDCLRLIKLLAAYIEETYFEPANSEFILK